MLEQHIGADVFRDGVRTYLKAHAYGNTVTTDLWDALEDASGAPVRGMMNTFILQGGHPLVSLHGDTVTQEPFAFGPPPPGTTSSIGTEWQVPLAVRAASRGKAGGADAAPGARAGSDSDSRGGPGPGGAERWRLGGVQGRLRIRASAGAGRAPGPADSAQRADLLADTWATTLAGRTALREFLVLASRLGLEPDPAPWAPVGGALGLTNRIALPDQKGALHEAVAALIGPIHRELGFDAHPTESDRTPSCARWLSTSWAPSAQTQRSGPRRPVASTPPLLVGDQTIRSPPTSRPRC